MNSELSSILAYMERERGLDREVLLAALEYALQSAARKAVQARDVRVSIERKTLAIKVFGTFEVVESKPGREQMELAKALKIKPDAKVGDIVETEVTPSNFGRIAAQSAKQTILQKIRQAERDMVFEEYKNRVGDIVSGSVKAFNRSDIIVDLGKAEAILPSKERVPTEEYQVGDRVRAYVLSVQPNTIGPGVTLSRAHPDFVRALFRLEVSEIADGVVEIKGVAREPGYRTKIAVHSKDEKVDPVGACVGMRGLRVKNIVRELSGEKIDIVRWSDDIRTYVANALSPAKLLKITVDPDQDRVVHVMADTEQLSLAIGKRGQNVRLTAKLVGWKIDIQREEADISFEEKVAAAVATLAAVPGIGKPNAELLVKAGFLTVEGILAAEVKDLEEMLGVDTATAQAIHDAAAAAQGDVPQE